MSNPIHIPALAARQKQDLVQRPNLYQLPQVSVSPSKSYRELMQIKATFEYLFYQVGEKQYGLRPKFDFEVEVTIPEGGKLAEMSYHIIGGGCVQVIMPICPILHFQPKVHEILKQVKEAVRTKSLEKITELIKRQEEIKKLIPAFQLYEELNNHRLKITRELKVTVYDETTKVSSIEIASEDDTNFRILTHYAKQTLIQKLEIIKQFEEQQEKKKETQNVTHKPVTI